MGALGSFPFLFPSLVEKRTAETEFWDNFIVLHAGDVNENGAILSQAFVKYGHNSETFFRFLKKCVRRMYGGSEGLMGNGGWELGWAVFAGIIAGGESERGGIQRR